MPWWAIAYLVVFMLATIAGVFDDLKRPNKLRFIGGEILSASFVILFVVGYFQESLGKELGIYVFPMLAIGMTHELMAATRTMAEESKDPNFTKKELVILNNIGLLLANIFIVPGYVFGLMLALRNVGL
jgi:hypothetical protein